MLSLTQAAAVIGLPPRTLAKYAHRGELDGRRIGRRWTFTAAAVDAFLAPAPEWSICSQPPGVNGSEGAVPRVAAPRTSSAKAQEASHKLLDEVRAKAAKNPSEPKRSKSKSERARDREGRFAGVRFNVEDIPRLPTFPARWVLDDPRRRPYFVFWTHADGAYALKMMPNDDGTAVRVTLDSGGTYRIDVLRRRLPRGSGTDLFYICPWCRTAQKYLYLLSVVGTELVDYQGLRCQRCAGLRYRIQGYYRSAFSRRLFRQPDGRTTIPLPREPWDPRAVSDPRLIADEFRGETEDPPPPPGAGADDVRPVGGAAGAAKR